MADPVANRRRGAKCELDLLKFFREQGFPTERRRLAGTADEGDLAVTTASGIVVIEAKNTRTLELTRFTREAEQEALNYGAARDRRDVTWRVVWKARGKGNPRDWFSIRRLGDEIAEWPKWT